MAEHNTDKEKHRASISERLLALTGLTVVVAMSGYLLYNAIWVEDTPPDIQVTIERIEQNGQDFLVIFEARNHGGQAAANVMVQAELRTGIVNTEAAETILNYIPADSSRKGGFFFRQDPHRGRLVLSVSAYQKP
ncbi:hypothetical protein F6455_03250 [Proteobacteria bacterium 005FR1]|nr:hypothetical protein [Proteobacteria bacterium 005FR1]